MIKVLEHGVRKVTCPVCKAKLQYEQEDIQSGNRMTYLDNENYNYIVCPDCGKEIILTPLKK